MDVSAKIAESAASTGQYPFERPRWMRDLERFLPLKSQFVLSGNVRDLHLSEGAGAPVSQPLVPTLVHALRRLGYSATIAYQPGSGFSVPELSDTNSTEANALLNSLGLESADGCAAATLDRLSDVLERVVFREGPPIALIIDFASRLVIRPDALSAVEHAVFTRGLILSHQARVRPVGKPSRPFFNSVLWIAEKEGDIPDWFLVSNPRIRHIPVARPDHQSRRALGRGVLRTLSGGSHPIPETFESALDELVDGTEGLLLLDIAAIVQLARAEGLAYAQVRDAVRRYKVGVTEDPWARIDKRKIANGYDAITARVRGQPHAVTHVLDIIKRALTGVGASRRGGRPRGVAFLAGPTGVGKTELAKTITSLLFGDESAYIRFDMSEFSAEHSDQRLIGAPPGYIGYDVGGELTNAIREKPFAVVLFDEIEKAHPRILDKFLQVLDDGVLTSGRGDRVYFSEAFIVFTSNLGIYRTDEHGQRVVNVQPSEGLDEIRRRVRNEIDRHFKIVLNRPEILNRIGENIVVFDFIRPEIGAEILDALISGIFRDLQETQGLRIELSPSAHNALRELCLADLGNGGRGIRNQVETHLLNPLARALFELPSSGTRAYRVENLISDAITSLTLAAL